MVEPPADVHNRRYKCTFNARRMCFQTWYACLTCLPLPIYGADFPRTIGFCGQCVSYCHRNHQLMSMDTKRLFHCECGDKRTSQLTCFLNSDKNTVRDARFQSCAFILKATVPDWRTFKIRCFLCEIWHPSILYDEDNVLTFRVFICLNCVMTMSFLRCYMPLISAHNESANWKKREPDNAIKFGHLETGEDRETGESSSAQRSLSTYYFWHQTWQEFFGESGWDFIQDPGTPPRLNTPNPPTTPPTTPGPSRPSSASRVQLQKFYESSSGSNTPEPCRKPAEGANCQPTSLFIADSHWKAMLCRCACCIDMYDTYGVKFLVEQDLSCLETSVPDSSESELSGIEAIEESESSSENEPEVVDESDLNLTILEDELANCEHEL